MLVIIVYIVVYNICVYQLCQLFHVDIIIINATGTPFPKVFITICKKILTRLYRVFVHVYIHHFDKLIKIGAVST